MESTERDSLLLKIREIEGELISNQMAHGTIEDLRRCVAWLQAGKPWFQGSTHDVSPQETREDELSHFGS